MGNQYNVRHGQKGRLSRSSIARLQMGTDVVACLDLSAAQAFLEGLMLNPSAQIAFSPELDLCGQEFKEAFSNMFAPESGYVFDHRAEGSLSVAVGDSVLLEDMNGIIGAKT